MKNNRQLTGLQLDYNKLEEDQLLDGMWIEYRDLLDQLPVITYVSSLKNPGKLLYIHPKIRELGFSQDTWLNNANGFFNLIHDDDRDNTIDVFLDAKNTHTPFCCEFRLVRDDSRPVWFKNEAFIVRDQHDTALFIQGTLTDITENKQVTTDLEYYRSRLEFLVTQRTDQLEKQCNILKSANGNLVNALSDQHRIETGLRNSEQHLRLLLESAGEGIFGIDTEGRCTFANPAALAMLGYSQDEIVDHDLYSLISMNNEDDSPSQAEKWDVYYASLNDVPLRNIQIFKHKNGAAIRVEYSSYPIQLNNELDGAVLIFRKVSESLCYQATHDPLTGLINRTEFWQRMTRALAHAHKFQTENILCYLDLDHFKEINDQCGHTAGDVLLRKLSALLQSKLRKRDSLARMGGDEFALLLEHCSLDQGCHVAEELCKAVQNFPFVWENNTYHLGISIGVTSLTKNDHDIGSVLRKADASCYMAKAQGRNNYQVFKFPFKTASFHKA